MIDVMKPKIILLIKIKIIVFNVIHLAHNAMALVILIVKLVILDRIY